MVLLDRRVTIDEVAHVLQISYGSAYEMMDNKRAWTSAKNIWIAMVTNETS